MMRDLEKLRTLSESYQRDGIILLKSFFDESLLKWLEKAFHGEFKKQIILNEAEELSPQNHAEVSRINFLFNSDIFLEAIRAISGLRPDFGLSRVYINDSTCVPLDWQDDSYSSYPRMAALRIELSRVPYEGGHFHFKWGEKYIEMGEMKIGDAVLFKVKTNKYFHKVDPIISGERRSIIVFFNIKDFEPDETY